MAKHVEKKERLHKVMAEAGVASRRQCEEMIRQGLVRVNSHIPETFPVLVDVATDRITVNGRALRIAPKVYYLLYKPKNILCTNFDPQGRTRAVDLLGKIPFRVFPVGRLDADSKGLIIMTNDGELTNLLTHPRYGVLKSYVAEIDGLLTQEEIDKLEKGVRLSHGKAGAEKISITHRGRHRTRLEITLREGQNRQIRRMLAHLGHEVRDLTRIRIGPLSLRGMQPGMYRPLSKSEVEKLIRSAQKPKAGQKRD
jgi:23S rRNA pseudouridine2605 synthase